MNYYFLLYFSLLISLLGIVGWLVSEAKYEGRHSKLINRITFVFPFFALYAWFRLNLDFGVVLVFLTFGSLLIWLLAKYLVIPRAGKESRSFFIIINFIRIKVWIWIIFPTITLIFNYQRIDVFSLSIYMIKTINS